VFIDKILLRDYRNYHQESVIFHRNANIIIGENAQGKTNLLEAVYFCAFGKSFRLSKDEDLIAQGAEAFRVKILFYKQGREQTIDIAYRKDSKKQVLLNGVPLKSLMELIGSLNVVLFSPEDLKLVKGGPSERRRFIDRELSHLNRRYMSDLIQYHRILNQRNKLLKSMQYKPQLKETLSVWDDQLANLGASIIVKRKKFIDQLGELAKLFHLQLTNNQEKIDLYYFTGIFEKSSFDYDKIVEEFKIQLSKFQDRDIKYGVTSFGPHKDDLVIEIDGKDSRKFASQGQQRTIALSLKLSQIKLVELEIGESPILLLDDVMSELDLKRQQQLIDSIKGIQTILTTTDLQGLDHKKMVPFSLTEISKGAVLSCREVEHDD